MSAELSRTFKNILEESDTYMQDGQKETSTNLLMGKWIAGHELGEILKEINMF